MNILVIEDDPGTAAEIVYALTRQGWAVEHLSRGEDGLRRAAAKSYTALVIDRLLPGLDGLSVLRQLRAKQVLTPALILSALGETDQKVEGLDCGADDYMAKPYAADELCARIRVLARRVQPHPEVILIKDLEIWSKWGTAKRAGEPLNLTPKEFKLLHYLGVNEGIAVTKKMILKHVFNLDFDPLTGVVEVHVSHLRAKLDKPHEKSKHLLHTVRGKESYVLGPGG